MEEARDFCRNRCQQLVSVEDPAEETELFKYLTSMGKANLLFDEENSKQIASFKFVHLIPLGFDLFLSDIDF